MKEGAIGRAFDYALEGWIAPVTIVVVLFVAACGVAWSQLPQLRFERACESHGGKAMYQQRVCLSRGAFAE